MRVADLEISISLFGPFRPTDISRPTDEHFLFIELEFTKFSRFALIVPHVCWRWSQVADVHCSLLEFLSVKIKRKDLSDHRDCDISRTCGVCCFSKREDRASADIQKIVTNRSRVR